MDEIDTTDLERDTQSEGDDDFGEGGDTTDAERFEENRINFAKAFLGKDGGYTVRQLKKFYR